MRLVQSIRRHRGRWAGGAIAVVLVVVIGGYFAIKAIQGKGDKPLTLNDAPALTTAPGRESSGGSQPAGGGPASATVNGTWKLAPGSQVGYRVKETLFGQSNTATGRTSAVTGDMTLGDTSVSAANFTVQMATVKSDRSQRDGQFRGRIMEVDQFPTATFVLTKPIELGSIPPEGKMITEQATGDLTLHGTKRTVTFTVNARRQGGAIQVQGQIPVTFSDYKIDNPSGGPASVGNNGILEFALTFSRA